MPNTIVVGVMMLNIPSPKIPPVLFTPKEVASLLNITERTLAKWRKACIYIPYLKIGKKVRYKEIDVYNFLAKAKLMTRSSAWKY